jgi:hypothetical protein
MLLFDNAETIYVLIIQKQRGIYEWNSWGLESDVYLLRIQTGNYVGAKKTVLLR